MTVLRGWSGIRIDGGDWGTVQAWTGLRWGESGRVWVSVLSTGQVSFQSSGVPVCIQVQLYLEEDGDCGPLQVRPLSILGG